MSIHGTFMKNTKCQLHSQQQKSQGQSIELAQSPAQKVGQLLLLLGKVRVILPLGGRLGDLKSLFSRLAQKCSWGFLGGIVVNNQPANAGDTRVPGLISGWGRLPGVGNGNPLQYSCLGGLIDRGAWQATVHGVAKSRTRLSN